MDKRALGFLVAVCAFAAHADEPLTRKTAMAIPTLAGV